MERDNYQFILEVYGDKFEKRIALFYQQFHEYIKINEIPEKAVSLIYDLVIEFVLDYFSDVERLKRFHRIERVNTVKIASFEAYWWVRNKPIQIVKFLPEYKEKLLLINEYFAASTLIAHIFDRNKPLVLDPSGLQKWRKFFDLIIYTFRYRNFTPYTLEFAVTGLLTEPMYEIRN